MFVVKLVETAKRVRARLQSCRKSNKRTLALAPAVFIFSHLQFRSGYSRNLNWPCPAGHFLYICGTTEIVP